MKPAYRPGLVPQVALKPRMGFRSRGMLLNELMGECPSLLNDLVFYPMWQGSQCVDMISGTVLTNTAGILPSVTSPNGELAGNYIASSSQFLSGSMTPILGDSEWSISVWVLIYAKNAEARRIISKRKVSTGYEFDLALQASATDKFSVSVSSGTEQFLMYSSLGATVLNTWYCVQAKYSSSDGRIYLRVGNLQNESAALVSRSTPDSAALLQIGSVAQIARPWDGCIGPTPIWKRLLSDKDQMMFYNNGFGVPYPC